MEESILESNMAIPTACRRRHQRSDLFVPEHVEVQSVACSSITGLDAFIAERNTGIVAPSGAVTTISPITIRQRVSDPYFKGSGDSKHPFMKCFPKRIRKCISRVKRRRKRDYILAEDFYRGLGEMGWEVEEAGISIHARKEVGSGDDTPHSHTATQNTSCIMIAIAVVMLYFAHLNGTVVTSSK